jgi:glycosyltransferase involved in cell wall biosynthesis
MAEVGMVNGATGRRPRLLVLNQYYAPGVEATARLLSELCVALSADFEVTVITGMLNVGGVTAGQTSVDGVRVIRVNSSSYDRRRLSSRAFNYLTYLARVAWAGMRVPRPDVIFCMTDPPMLADVGLLLARRFRVPLVVTSQDVFPEAAVQLKRLDNPLVISLLRGLVALYLARADRVIAIGSTMRNRLEAKGARSDRLCVIPNWVDTQVLTPQPRENEWAEANGLAHSFVVMHSGNVGHAQDLDSLIRTSTFLRDLKDLTIAIIGTGARHPDLLRLADTLETSGVRFFPYQPREALALSLSSADIHVVGLAAGLSGYVVPSRLYGILSVGRPVIVAADGDSETAQLVTRVGCGIVVPPGRPELLAAALRSAYEGELDLAEMGSRAREYAVAEASRDVAVGRYRSLFEELVAR